MRTLLNEGENSCARSLGGTITCSLDGSAPSAVRPQGQQLAQPDFEKRRLRGLASFELNSPKKEGVGDGRHDWNTNPNENIPGVPTAKPTTN